MPSFRRQNTLVAACSVLALSPQALAQAAPTADAAPSDKRIFAPDFFASYSPVSALDMVRRIPGFSISGSDGRRGFGENAGNVLIDGERPSTKSDDLQTILGRIPASQVERIELTESSGAGSDAIGQGQVVNVIRKAGSATSGTYEIAASKSLNRAVMPAGSASVSIKRGQTTYELNAEYFSELQRGYGPEDFLDSGRSLKERRRYDGRGGYREAEAGASVKTRTGKAKINLNAKMEWSDGEDLRLGIITAPGGAVIGNEILDTTQPASDLSWELGGDIEFPLAAKLSTKLVGLYRSGREGVDARIETTRGAAGTTQFISRNRNKPTEAVFRAQNEWTGFKDHTIQFGAEFAYNRLDARFTGTSISATGLPQISRSNVLVRETRFEPFISDVWAISPKWKLESGAIFEFSKLSLSGDSTASRSFRFGKPHITATWTPSKQTTFEFRAVHQVAQLNFEEFATSVDLGQGNQVDAGNQDLVPDKTTTFSALIRRKFMDRGSIQLKGSYDLIRDTLDIFPVAVRDSAGTVFFVDGTGNVGDSRRWNGELEITLPFDWITKGFGVSGMELKYIGHYHGSRVTDPVTGLNRRASFRPLWHQDWIFRHDIAKAGIAWGFNVRAAAPQNVYFVSQFRSQYDSPNVGAFAEYKKWKLGTLKFEVFDLTSSAFFRERYLYRGTRASQIVTDIISRKRKLDPQFKLSLSGKF